MPGPGPKNGPFKSPFSSVVCHIAHVWTTLYGSTTCPSSSTAQTAQPTQPALSSPLTSTPLPSPTDGSSTGSASSSIAASPGSQASPSIPSSTPVGPNSIPNPNSISPPSLASPTVPTDFPGLLSSETANVSSPANSSSGPSSIVSIALLTPTPSTEPVSAPALQDGVSSIPSLASSPLQSTSVTESNAIYSSSPADSSAISTASQPASASSRHKTSASAIAGSVVGALFLILLVVLLFYRRPLAKRLARIRLPWRKSAHTAPSAEFMNHPVVLAQRRSSSALLRAASPLSYGNTGAATAPSLRKYPYADSYDGYTFDEAPPPFTTGNFNDPIMEKVSASAAVHQRMFSADSKADYGYGAGDASTLMDHEVGSPEEMSEVGHAV
ncbi:hypothetical protein EIP86_011577 [Pleurotus ostreatoroseus]|nr:hypothetical protein EIP86_011577 [Pleurotus ostreatoroseus]